LSLLVCTVAEIKVPPQTSPVASASPGVLLKLTTTICVSSDAQVNWWVEVVAERSQLDRQPCVGTHRNVRSPKVFRSGLNRDGNQFLRVAAVGHAQQGDRDADQDNNAEPLPNHADSWDERLTNC
jgi:hypothetical protein